MSHDRQQEKTERVIEVEQVGNGKVSYSDCVLMREKASKGYPAGDVGREFGYNEATAHYHISGECEHSEIKVCKIGVGELRPLIDELASESPGKLTPESVELVHAEVNDSKVTLKIKGKPDGRRKP